MRLLLLRLAEAEYRCIWTSHHALLDGRARLLVLKELFAIYEADCQGQTLRLDPPRAYGDYIEWLGNQDFSRSEGFWRQLLDGFTAPTPLSVGRAYQARSHEETSIGEQAIVLSVTLTSSMRRLAQQHQLTPNTFLQGAWGLLLSRYSGEQEVVFGATRACRRSVIHQAESMAGPFINTLPLRLDVPSETRLLPWLKRLRAQWVEMREYEHSPLVKVQEWSGMGAGKPLFESIAVFENYQLNSVLRAEGGAWNNREFRLLGATNYPLTITGYLGPELLLRFAYDRSRFDDATMARMLGHLQTLLEGIVADTGQRLSELSLLTDVERYQLLQEWNDTTTDYPRNHGIHQLFEAQAEQTPEAIALVFEGQQLTYRELNSRANQLAHHLTKRGVGPEVLVGICMERSVELIVGLLGILKTGGAYVPLDPAYPRERLAFLLEDSRVPVLLTQEVLMDRLPEQAVELVCVDREWPLISQEREENLATAMSPANLAYVIYTSGSTGIPKGVEVTQGGLVNLVAWHQQVYHVTPADRATQLSSPAFDASVWELWPYLTAGASIYLPDEVTRVSPSLLLEWLVAQAITLCFLPTPLAEGVLQEALPEGLALRALLTGGDKLHAGLQEVLPFSLINHYGPTENTVVTTFAPVSVRKEVGVPPSVGRPIANTQVYLLDWPLQPVPVGVSPVQVIAPALSVALPVKDLGQLPEAERQVQTQRLSAEEAQRPFDLAQGPLLRATLLRLAEQEHVLLLTLHHIVSDGWSMGVFYRQLAVLYQAFSTGSRPMLPELPIQYPDFSHWQRHWLQGEVLDVQLGYWKRQLGGSLPVLQLHTDRPRPAVQTFRGARHTLLLPKRLSEALRGLSRQEGVTLFMTLLAAFQTLLHRYTGQDDIIVGSPVAGRTRAETEGLIGFFVNTLVLRTDLSGEPRFRQLLARVREVALGAYGHQDLPFEKPVEELQPERDLSRTPLFRVMFALQSAPGTALQLSGLTTCPLEVDSRTAKFDLSFSTDEEPQSGLCLCAVGPRLSEGTAGLHVG
jgi:amino acid adenylation domain-containing protein